MDPALSGMALFQKAILAKAPPALAPGAMTQLGLIGLAYTFRHPAMGSREDNMTRFVAFALALLLAAPGVAQVGKSLGVVDANTISEADLTKLPGMTPAIAKAVVAARPFDSITAFNTFLLGQKLTQEQANELYKNMFVHINLNTATGDGDHAGPRRRQAHGARVRGVPAVEVVRAVREGDRQVRRRQGSRAAGAVHFHSAQPQHRERERTS